MLPQKIAFVDIETTGGSSFYDRIIEIGIVRVENNEIVDTFQSLINPEAHIPREIELLTGITSSDLENAPTFRQLKDEIQEKLQDYLFVAHNVRFDYGFLKHEFKRENITFSTKHFCTVKLSRLLYPRFIHHNLDSIIERHNFDCKNRHRALDDAQVLFQFYKKIQQEFTEEILDQSISKTMKKPSIPLKIPASTLENLPENPGVYIFYGESGMPLYIGKSINLKERIHSHFSGDIHSPTEMNISQQITSIETIQTSGELGALLLETQMIKKHLPLYNKVSRIKQELIAVKSRTNKEGYMETYLDPITKIEFPDNFSSESQFLGFFRSRKQAKAFLTDISKTYILCDKLLGLEKANGACFRNRLDQCNGACIGEENALKYNMRFAEAFAGSKILPWPFDGTISIEEQGLDGKKEYFLVNNWCYIGNVVVDEQGEKKEEFIKEVNFDLDTYKIIKRFLKNPANKHKISLVNYDNFNNSIYTA